jgi:hypothetical protein
MLRMTSIILRGAMGLALLGTLGACDHTALHNTYGRRYRELFAVQASERSAQAPAPFRGDEERRVIGAYYERLAPGGSSASSGSQTQTMSGGSSLSPLSTGTNTNSGVDLRAR